MRNKRYIEIEIEGVSRPLEEWAEIDPSIHFPSARVRLSNRYNGKRDCTDAEVLWGYARKESSKERVKVESRYTGEWINRFSAVLNKNLNKFPLLEAIIHSLEIMENKRLQADGLSETPKHLFSEEGNNFSLFGQSLEELLENNDGDVSRLIRFLVEDGSIPLDEVKTFFIGDISVNN